MPGPTTIVLPGQDHAPGLIVSASGKRQRTLTIDTWKKVLRLMRDVKPEGFRARFECADCSGAIHLTVPNPASPRLACECTEWVGR